MANLRIYQTLDLSGSISPNDLILTDKYQGSGSYTTGFKKISDIINYIRVLPTANFTNINTSINNNTTAITTLDNSIEPRIETFTRTTAVTRDFRSILSSGNGSWVYTPYIPLPINLTNVNITNDDKHLFFITCRMTAYTLDTNSAASSYRNATNIYAITKDDNDNYIILNSKSIYGNISNTSNLAILLNGSFAGNNFQIRGRTKNFTNTTNVYFKTEFSISF